MRRDIVLVLVPTNSVVEWFSSLFVPHQGGLSLIGHTQRWEKKQQNEQIKQTFSQPVCHASSCRIRTRLPLSPIASPTLNARDVDVELDEFLTGPLNALIHRLDDLFGVLLHPPGWKANNQPCKYMMYNMCTSPALAAMCPSYLQYNSYWCNSTFECINLKKKPFSFDMRLKTHPSLGKLWLISTWCWHTSSAVFELNTCGEKKHLIHKDGNLNTLHIRLILWSADDD